MRSNTLVRHHADGDSLAVSASVDETPVGWTRFGGGAHFALAEPEGAGADVVAADAVESPEGVFESELPPPQATRARARAANTIVIFFMRILQRTQKGSHGATAR